MLDKNKDFIAKAEALCRSYEEQKWFVDTHLVKVLGCAEWLCEQFPEANKDAIIAAVWLHDIIYFVDFSKADMHAELGAEYAREMMNREGLPQGFTDMVCDIILRHSAKALKPETLEAKLFATADAMSHMTPDFYLSLLMFDNNHDDMKKFKRYVLDKMERDFNEKILFDVARDKVRDNYLKMKAFFELD